MRLGDIMSVNVETANLDESAEDAWQRMTARRIHHLVVKDGKTVVGVLSDRDLGGRNGRPMRRERTVGELMSQSSVTADANMTVREAANRLRGRGIGCLPIVDGSKLIGIVTVTDLLELIGRGVEKPIQTSTRWTLKRRAFKLNQSRRPARPTPR